MGACLVAGFASMVRVLWNERGLAAALLYLYFPTMYMVLLLTGLTLNGMLGGEMP